MNIERLRLKPFFTIIAHDKDTIELRAGVWNHVSYMVEDETKSGVLYQFLKALDGTQTLAEIARALEMPRSEAESVIDYLLQLNVLDSVVTRLSMC